MNMKKTRILGLILAFIIFFTNLPLGMGLVHAEAGNVAIDEAHFRDGNFRKYLKTFDNDGDGSLSQKERDDVKHIDVNEKNIESLQGLEYFTNLINLDCADNQLSELDVSKNTALIFLNCTINQLSELDVSKNINLKVLQCYQNQLTKIELGDNTNLETLHCYGNQLTNLDVSKNTNLETFSCYDNQLTKLELADNTNLKYLSCNKNQLSELDVSKNTNIETLYCEDNQLTKIELGDNTNLVNLNCIQNQLTKLDVSKNTNIKYLSCYINKLTNLDVSKNTSLEELNCGDNKLTKLEVGENTNFTKLYFYNNQLTNLDLSNIQVKELDCRDQQYNITVIKGTKKFEYSKFPGQFNKDKVTSPVGASFGDDALIVNSDDTSKVTYNYNVDNKNVMKVTLNVTYKNPKVIVPNPANPGTVPTGRVRVTFDAGEGNTIDGTNRYKYIDVLENTPWTDQEVTEQIPTTAKYKDTTKEFNKWSEAVPTTGNVEAKTFTAVYKDAEKVVVPNPANPGTVPTGRVRVTFDAGEGNTIDGTNRYKYIDVLENTPWTDQEVTEQIPTTAKYKDTTKEFNKWSEAVPTTGNVEAKTFTAEYKAVGGTTPTDPKVIVPDPTNPGTVKPGMVRLTFDATVDGNINGNQKKYVDVKVGTAWTDQEVTKQIPTTASYKDNTKTFEKWEPLVPTTGNVTEAKEFTAEYKAVGGTTPTDPTVVGPVDPRNPNTPIPNLNEYYEITFISEDESKGTVAKANTVYVEKRVYKTYADLARFAPTATPYYGYEFAGWSPYLYGNPTIINSNMVIYARFEELYTPSYPYPYERRRPRRKYDDRHDRYDRDDNEEEKIEEAKVYNKLEAILFINNYLMQKSVNGVVSQVRMDIAPFIYQARTMLPIRFVAESLGFMVTWDAKTKTVYLSDKENIIQIPVDTNNIIVNGNTFVSDVKPMIKNNRTVLPVANIARALGLVDGKDILWDAARAMVTLKRNVLK